MSKIIYIRSELNKNERRTPIVPNDIPILLEHGFIVYIESSTNRIYKDDEYLLKGGFVTNKKWYESKFQNAYIIGLKEIEHLDKLINHKHVYFSHSFKKQFNSQYILSTFYKNNSLIYDFEFFLDNENKRLISFGFYAGIVGCYLGLLQFIEKTILKQNIKNFHSYDFDIKNSIFCSIRITIP
jgi:alanine dehydrogenase